MITNNYLFASQFVNFLKSNKINADQLKAFKSVFISFSNDRSQNGEENIIEDFIKPVINILQFGYGDFIPNNTQNAHYCYLYDGFPLQNKVSCIYAVAPDTHIDSTTKGSFPAFELIHLLKKEKLEWGILTNGTKWRLYSTLNVQPYENYFEIDFSSSDDSDFKAFDQLFSVQLFIPDQYQITRLEHFIETSDKEAKIIEDHLKANINEILETISFGFLSYSGKIDKPLNEEEKQEYFNNSVYLLFRLLFIFYAESRKLLPISSPEYDQVSLENMLGTSKKWLKDDVFEDEDGIDLWFKFRELCINIDQGNSAYLIPEYDGGLFDIHQHPFLNNPDHQLTNQIFAKVLYALGYFSKGKNTIKIDYRDLSVRSLGTLYEGLLEYKLFIAKEDLVFRDKKFIPKSSAGLIKKSEREIPAGHVYFSQSADERHDTGSYYTPEDVVNYMVNNSVRLGLEERWIDFLPTVKKIETELKSAYSHPIRNSLLHRFDEELLNFVNTKILTFRVIDPTMGSGHFLVNALHCITHFILEVLSCAVELSNGPIKHEKVPILIDWSLFHSQSDLSINPGYWRRKVVERCIFGIDLNPLATELSKLALWIASSSEGKPLAFLNHHLKRGDSIMGISVEDLLLYPTNRNAKKKNSEPKLFDKLDISRFEQVKIRFDELLSLSSDDISNVFSKKDIFLEIESDFFLKHLKDLASLWLMISFDLNRIKTKSLFDSNTLPDEDTYFNLVSKLQEIDNDQDWENEIGSSLYQEILNFNKEKAVFHWELEFPEILNSGFDAAIGNPPYVDVFENDYIGVPLECIKSSNLYAYVPERAYHFLKNNQYSAFIPRMMIGTSKRMIYFQNIFLKHKVFLMNIDSTSNPGTLFNNVKTPVSIITLKKDFSSRLYITNYIRFYQDERKQLFIKERFYRLENKKLILDYTIPKISSAIEEEILNILFEKGISLDNYYPDNIESLDNENYIYYRRAGSPYYRLAFDKPSYIEVDGIQVISDSIRSIRIKNEFSKYIVITPFYSSLYYWFWTVYSDCFNFDPKDLKRFPLNLKSLNSNSGKFKDLYTEIENDLNINGEDVVYNKANGVTKYKLLRAKKSKHIFDKVDSLLGNEVGLSNEMIDFLINYDSKYRTDEKCQDDN
jgi:hypothetical protein